MGYSDFPFFLFPFNSVDRQGLTHVFMSNDDDEFSQSSTVSTLIPVRIKSLTVGPFPTFYRKGIDGSPISLRKE